MLKCVNLIEIRLYAYLYASSFLVLRYIIFETTAQIPEVELGGQYGYMRANTDMYVVLNRNFRSNINVLGRFYSF
jgi:hypothetical protein